MQLGTDVVDLRCDASIRPGFVARILSAAERSRHPDLESHPDLVWAIWAAKEAAFKAFRQSELKFFIPSRWVVDLEQSAVTHEHRTWDLRLATSFDAVMATCVSRPFPYRIVHELDTAERERSPEEQRRDSRRIVQEVLDRHAPYARLIKDGGGVPRVLQGETSLPFSLSHHGRHIAVSLGLPTSP